MCEWYWISQIQTLKTGRIEDEQKILGIKKGRDKEIETNRGREDPSRTLITWHLTQDLRGCPAKNLGSSRVSREDPSPRRFYDTGRV